MCLGLVLGITCAASLQAATATFRQGVNGYNGTADTHINGDNPTARFPNNAIILVDNNAPVAHGLIRFDQIFGDGPGQVPLNATITSASLTLRTSNLGDDVWFHRMLVAWEETNNWNELTTSGPGLQSDDIEMSSTPDFTFRSLGGTAGRVDTFDVTATVQGWFAGTFPNFGWGITNQIADGWQFDSSENATVTFRPLLTIVFEAPCAPVQIVTQPAGGTVDEGTGPFTFSVIVRGTGPLYQWYKDGVPIPDATNSTYSINPVTRSDEGTYTVVIDNECTEPAVISADAVLNVNEDLVSPSIVCAYGTNDNITLFVEFSEIVTNATDPVNYTISPVGGGDALVVASATYSGGSTTQGRVVVLVLDPTTPFAPGAAYNISAGAVFDRFGNPIDPAEVTPVSLYSENVFRISGNEPQVWTFDQRGIDIGDTWKLKDFDDSAWPSGPGLLGFETAALPEPLRTPVVRTNAAGVIRTFYFRTHFNYDEAPGEGVLRFRQILDDANVIYLNGAEIFRIRMPAGVPNWQTPGSGVVGDAVYAGPFTVCVTNLMAGDNVIAVEVHQTGDNSSDMVWGMELFQVVQSITPVSIEVQPVGTNVFEPQPFSLRVIADGSNPQYQWQRSTDGGTTFTDVAGATNAVYTVSFSHPCENYTGHYRVRVFNDAPSEVFSTAVFVDVDCDEEGPFITCLYGTNDVVVIVFNEITTNGCCVEGAELNYYIDDAAGNPLAIASASYTSGTNTGTTVLLVIDPSTPRDPNTAYRIRVGGIADRFENFMTEVTLPIPFFAGPQLIGINATQQWRYDTSGTDQGTAWRAAAYDDSAWPSGAALFDGARGNTNATGQVGCRDMVNGQTVRTCITISNATGTAQIPTAYFRTHFNHTGPSTAVLAIRPFIDDGAVFYLNGQQILRQGMSQTATITYTTLANRTVGSANFEGPFYVCVTNLNSGDNVLAVELHQASLTSSDMTFGTELNVLSDQPPPPEARLTITNLGDGRVRVSWTGNGVLQRATDLATPSDPVNGWRTVTGATSPHEETVTGNAFFRIAP